MKLTCTAVVSAACICLALCLPARADVKVPGLFTSGAVLQRDMAIPVWGWADPGEAVTVTLDKDKVSTKAGPDGKWSLKLASRPAGGPFEMTIAGKNTLTLQDVLVGDVWLCAGQSNMAWTVDLTYGGKEAIEQSTNPSLHLFTNAQKDTKTSETPSTECLGTWAAASPASVRRASAVAYYFGRELQAKIKVPVGIIYYAWGATLIENWTSLPALEADPDGKIIVERNKREIADYPRATAEYKASVEEAKANPDLYPMRGPRSPFLQNTPSAIYNGLINPLVPYALRGMVWYQGESNSDRSEQYRRLLPLMIKDWRTAWGQGDLPFLIVQISGCVFNGGWAELREAQLMTWQKVPNTGMVVTSDIGERHQPHPGDKVDVGKRLALSARFVAYGEKDLVYSGPIYKSMKVEGDKIRISFDHVGSGLVAKGGPLAWFEIAGEGPSRGLLVPAKAEIDGDTVVVWADGVTKPTSVRYGWTDSPDGMNLYNKEGLPASTFRTDKMSAYTTGLK